MLKGPRNFGISLARVSVRVWLPTIKWPLYQMTFVSNPDLAEYPKFRMQKYISDSPLITTIHPCVFIPVYSSLSQKTEEYDNHWISFEENINWTHSRQKLKVLRTARVIHTKWLKYRYICCFISTSAPADLTKISLSLADENKCSKRHQDLAETASARIWYSCTST